MEDPDADTDSLREMTAIADELLEQAGAIRRQWDELADLLAAKRSVRAADLLDEASPKPLPAPTGPDAGRLVAIDMVLSGRGREDVVAYLRRTFPEQDPEAVADQVISEFGS